MSDQPSVDTAHPDEERLGRRLFLQSLGKWSSAAIAAAVFGGAWLASPPEAEAGAWVNRRGGYGGGWINGRGYGGGGGWINGHGGGGGAWVNRRSYGGGGAWVNRW
jgi:CubicO group peptidase (beta-lactamase class C family)